MSHERANDKGQIIATVNTKKVLGIETVSKEWVSLLIAGVASFPHP